MRELSDTAAEVQGTRVSKRELASISTPDKVESPHSKRPASIVSPQTPQFVRKVTTSAWVELAVALRWSWLSIQFLGVPIRALYWIGLAVWVLSAVVVIAHPRAEDLLARKVYRLRPHQPWNLSVSALAWWAVCTAAGVDPNRYRVWIHEGSEATAPATAGTTVAVPLSAIARPAARLEIDTSTT